jgi:hypothetical protein
MEDVGRIWNIFEVYGSFMKIMEAIRRVWKGIGE